MLGSAFALQAEVEGINRVKSAGGVTEYRLAANGLTILLAPQERAAATTFSVTYRVGSRNESYGTTGATHLLEHLMFKGTATHNKQVGTGIDQILEGLGAETNAATGFDCTTYTTTLSPEHLSIIIELEADRMRNLRLREEDMRPEMSVVWDEYDCGEDDPAMALDREIWATAFQAHPYRHSVIGWRSDIENVPLAKLLEFYEAHYWPDQATVAVTGSIDDTDAVLATIKRLYGPIPHSAKPIPTVYTAEPRQTGLRRLTMKRPGDAGVVTIAFKSPPARHPDYPTLQVLCDLLADGENCRFSEALTDAGLTLDVTATAEATLDPSLLLISAELAEKATHEEVEDGILEVLDEVIEKGVKEDEVKTSIIRLTAQAAIARDGSSALAEALAESIGAGDWTLYQSEESAIRSITAAKVTAAAKRWLIEDSCTVGWFVSDPEADAAEPSPTMAKAATPTPETSPLILPELPPVALGVPTIAPRVTRTRTAGIDLLVCPGGTPDIVRLSGSIPAGTPSNLPLASLVTMMIQHGTTSHSATDLGRVLDENGITLEFTADGGYVYFSASCLSAQLPRLLSLLAEQLRNATFPEGELKHLRSQLISDARLSRTDPQTQASLALNRAIFPAGHPNRLPDPDETIASLQTLRRKNLADFYQEWFGPAGAVFVLAGDLKPSACQAEVERCFGGWTGGKKPPTPVTAPILHTQAALSVPVAGKESVTVLIGTSCRVRLPEQDALALSLATAALGDGFTSRLLNSVRDTEGLTYNISANLSIPDERTGIWSVSASFSPELLSRGIDSTRREILRWHHDGLSQNEFIYRRNALVGAHRVQLASTASLTAALHSCILQGLSPEWLDQRSARLQALTLDDVNGAIRRHLDPGCLIEVKCGPVGEH